MRISDWSSDVCSSDLPRQLDASGRNDRRNIGMMPHRVDPLPETIIRRHRNPPRKSGKEQSKNAIDAAPRTAPPHQGHYRNWQAVHPDRKSVVSGKSVSVRVERGGCRIIKTKQIKQDRMQTKK